MALPRVQTFRARNSRAVRIELPTNAENVTLGYAHVAVSARQLAAVLQGSGGQSLSWNLQYATTRNSGAPTNVLSSSNVLTSITAGNIITTFASGEIPAGNWIWLITTAKAGAVSEFFLSAYIHGLL